MSNVQPPSPYNNSQFSTVPMDGPADWIGREVRVHVDEALRHTLRGSAVDP